MTRECMYGPRGPDGKCPKKGSKASKASTSKNTSTQNAPKTPKAKTPKPKKEDCKHGPRVNGLCPKAAAKEGVKRRHPKILRDTDRGLTKPAIKRLAHKAGVMIMSGLLYEEARGVTKVFLDKIIRDAWIMAEYAQRKTLMLEDVKQALAKNGRTLYWHNTDKVKRCPVPGGKKRITKVRQIQQQAECVHFSVAPFKRVIKEILQDYANNAKLNVAAASALQIATEAYLVELFEHSQSMAIHAKRKTLMPKNIQLARRTMGNN